MSNEDNSILIEMRTSFERDFRHVADTYVGKIREIGEKFSLEIRGGKQDVRDSN